MTTVLIAGGGTGGHVFPMVAVGDALRALRSSCEIVYVGTGRGIEQRVLAELGERLELLDVLPLRGHGFGGFIKGGWRALMVLGEARALVKRIAPDVVFSVGGYAAGPVTLAAKSCGLPVTLLEPNAAMGFTNRVLGPLVRRAYLGFPEVEAQLNTDVVRVSGVPLRRRFAPAPYRAGERVRILVMGGSQGAQALNEALPRALGALITDGLPIDVVHQTGRGKDDDVRALYSELGIAHAVTLTTFIDDVAAALADADVVIERCGASACAELCAVGRAGILIPYPFAADDHQRKNAESLARDGAVVCLPQAEADSARLETELRRLVTEPTLRSQMAASAARRGRPDASKTIAADLLALADAATLVEAEVVL
jgi:UDP-N-acetylglucosamine--N-acetylmuramyl-(pentapeptide) pyrophosphoryl-undecaprenol N-acetylglucosamine transferase